MPLYTYEILDEQNNPTNEFVEIFQKMSDPQLEIDPESGKKIKKCLTFSSVRDGRPAWERCSDVKEHMKNTRPKWMTDKEKGIRERFDPKKHG